MDKSVTKLLTLFEALAKSDAPRGISDLARELNLTKTNVHRLVRTLEARGYVRRVGEVSKYELTLRLWELGVNLVSRLDLKKTSQFQMSRLARETGETVHLSVPDGLEIIYIDKIESGAPVRVHTEIGQRAPMYCVGTGKAILAFLPEEQVERLKGKLKAYTKNTITDFADLKCELAKIRNVGYAQYESEFRDGVNSLGAPIRNVHGDVIAAIGIAGPETRLSADKFEEMGPLVVDAATSIAVSLGWQPAHAVPVPDEELPEHM